MLRHVVTAGPVANDNVSIRNEKQVKKFYFVSKDAYVKTRYGTEAQFVGKRRSWRNRRGGGR